MTPVASTSSTFQLESLLVSPVINVWPFESRRARRNVVILLIVTFEICVPALFTSDNITLAGVLPEAAVDQPSNVLPLARRCAVETPEKISIDQPLTPVVR